MKTQPSYSNQPTSREKKNISSDKLLWNSFKEGSTRSFQYIYDQNYKKLLNYGLNLYSNQYLVEDQIQELFIYLWQKKENLDINVSITAYLLWSLRNRIINHLKIQKQSMSEYDYDQIYQEEDSTSEKKFDRLKEAIDSLPMKQKEAVNLKYFQNLNAEEIASVLNITIGTTYNLLSRSIETLRAQMPKIIFALYFLL